MSGWKLVPVEPTEEMIRFAGVCVPKTPRAQWNAMLAAAPQPHAGGEPEVLAVLYNDGCPVTLTAAGHLKRADRHIAQDGIELIDQAHFTALQARLEVAEASLMDAAQLLRKSDSGKGVDHKEWWNKRCKILWAADDVEVKS